jgi:hypothetical protein
LTYKNKTITLAFRFELPVFPFNASSFLLKFLFKTKI